MYDYTEKAVMRYTFVINFSGIESQSVKMFCERVPTH